MKTEWSKKTVADAWTHANGSEEYPFGDHWRIDLINPAVFGVLKCLQDEKRRGYHGYRTDAGTVIEAGIREQRVWMRENKRSTLEWHNEVAQNPCLLNGVHILDLGCGEGYLGRWLNKMGADYTGVDCSPTLINTGKSRATISAGGQKVKKAAKSKAMDKGGARTPRYDLFAEDVEDVTKLESVLFPAKGDARSFDLIVCGILIEHLTDPQKLLSWVSAHYPDTPLLLFTLNPDYFLDYPGERTRHEMRECPQLIKAHISSAADTEVDVFFRIKEQVDELLRDCRYHSIESTPLYFDGHHAPLKEPRQAIAPFHCHYAKPLPPRCCGNKEILDVIGSLVIKKSLDPKEGEILLKKQNKLELIDYGPQETVMWPHNIGGDLFYVVSGTLELQPGIGLPILFGPDCLLGDLETGDAKLSGYYIYPVVVADKSARVLRIPASVAVEMMSVKNGITSSLFRGLRDRLAKAVWEMNYRSRNLTPATTNKAEKERNPSKHINLRNADRVIRILLAASESERRGESRSNRSVSGSRLLIDTPDINRLTRLNLKQGPTPLYRILYRLTALGIVDGFSGQALKRITEIDKFYEEKWGVLVVESAKKFLFAKDSSRELKDAATKVLNEIIKNDGKPREELPQGIEFNSNMLPKGRWREKVKTYRTGVHELLAGRDATLRRSWEARVDQWLTFLARANAFWFEDEPLFFYIHDQRLLRELALEPEEFILRRLKIRQGVLGVSDIPTRAVELVPFKDSYSRQKFYVSQYFEFCRDDLESDEGGGGRQLRFSGQSHGVRLAEWS